MRIRFIFIYCLISVAGLSCKDDENSGLSFLSETHLTIDNKFISLKGAKLYLTDSYLDVAYNDTRMERNVRIYTITNGIFTNYTHSNGYSLNDYENETYFIVFKLASANRADLFPGEFPLYSHLPYPGPNEPIGQIYIDAHWDMYIMDEFNADNPRIEVSGGLDNGNSMTINFKGELYRMFNPTTGALEKNNINAKINYSGTVIDAR